MYRRLAGALIAALAAGAALWGQAQEPGRAVHLGSLRWHQDGDWFGGLSGLDLTPDGSGFVAITDRATLITGQFQRDAAGVVAQVVTQSVTPLLDSKGQRLTRRNTDAEGLALLPGGGIAVSFEGNSRVMIHDPPTGPARFAGDPAGFARLQLNSGLEALAIDPAGRLVTLPERSEGETLPFPVWRLDNGRWRRAFQIDRQGSFLVVGADYGPDERLYVLERAFTGFGFASRLRRFAAAAQGIQQGEVLISTGTGLHDNLESVAIWRDAQGRLRATLVSDDNFHLLQRSELVDYLLPD